MKRETKVTPNPKPCGRPKGSVNRSKRRGNYRSKRAGGNYQVRLISIERE